MTTPMKDSTKSYTGSGMASLLQLLPDLVQANRPFVETYALTFFVKENGLLTWRLKSQIGAQLSD